MPTYLYGLWNGEPAVLMYTDSQARYDTPGVTIRQETDFPASGEVKLHIQPDQPVRFALHLRIPPYAQGASVQVNGETAASVTPGSFAVIEREWQLGDTLQLHLPFSITAQANRQVAALVRGPLVYGYFQKAQPDPVVFAGRRGVFPEDVVMHLDPRQPSVQETPAPAGLLGPALLVPGHIKPQVPMFAQEAGNAQLETQRETQLLLLPFANQGATRGDYQVFLNYE
jgi:DUF1680 family protein